MSELKNFESFFNKKINESTVEIEDSEEGVYVLTLHDIHNIVNSFTDTEINEEAIIEELQDYKFVKVDDAEITKIDDKEIKVDPLYVENEPVEEVDELDELSSDDENPTFIKKFEM